MCSFVISTVRSDLISDLGSSPEVWLINLNAEKVCKYNLLSDLTCVISSTQDANRDRIKSHSDFTLNELGTVEYAMKNESSPKS